MKKKVLSLFLATTLLLSGNVIVLANTIEVNSNTSQSVDVSADIESSYTVTIPKSIVINGDSKTAEYEVTVTGDIAGNEYVSVVPDGSFALGSTNKNDVTASVTLDKTEWYYDEMLADSNTVGNGDITASSLTAGEWSGNLNFDIKLNIIPDPGLYNADGVMLASWEESGIDVTKDYTSSTYKTDAASPYVVLSSEEYAAVTQVVIPEGVTNIGSYAFYACKGLTSVTIPEGVTSIGYYAFQNCTGLTGSLTIPEGVTSIGGYAFQTCKGLTSITIPESVKSIGEDAFAYCIGLTSIIVEEGNTVYDSRNNCNAIIKTATNTLIKGCNNTIIPEDIEKISNYAFYGYTGLTSITIPEGVTSIGNYAFSGCTSLTSITLPDGVTSIGECAFQKCTNLTSITIPEGVTSIGQGAFQQCKNLTSITIPASVTSIGQGAFYICTNLSITWNGTTYTYAEISTFNTAIKDAGIATSNIWS